MAKQEEIINPWKDSLWMDCLFELMVKGRKEGKEKVEFADVDRLVVEKSKVIREYKVVSNGN